MKTYTIVLGETFSPGAKSLHRMLREDLPEAKFVETNIGSLLINEKAEPDVLVLDMSQSSFQQTQKQMERLRTNFSRIGILVFSENTEIDTLSVPFRFVTASNWLLMELFKKHNTIENLVTRSISLARQ